MAKAKRAKPAPRKKPAPHARPTITQDQANKKIQDEIALLQSRGVPPEDVERISALIRYAFDSHVG